MPDFYITKDLEEGRLVPLLEDYELPKLSMFVVYPPGTRTVTQRLFTDFLIEELVKKRGDKA